MSKIYNDLLIISSDNEPLYYWLVLLSLILCFLVFLKWLRKRKVLINQKHRHLQRLKNGILKQEFDGSLRDLALHHINNPVDPKEYPEELRDGIESLNRIFVPIARALDVRSYLSGCSESDLKKFIETGETQHFPSWKVKIKETNKEDEIKFDKNRIDTMIADLKISSMDIADVECKIRKNDHESAEIKIDELQGKEKELFDRYSSEDDLKLRGIASDSNYSDRSRLIASLVLKKRGSSLSGINGILLGSIYWPYENN